MIEHLRSVQDLAVSVDPNVEENTNRLKELGIQAAAILIATAMVIFFWRMLNDKAKFAIIAAGLVLIFFVFVLPNLG